jgi:hypothetical protein
MTKTPRAAAFPASRIAALLIAAVLVPPVCPPGQAGEFPPLPRGLSTILVPDGPPGERGGVAGIPVDIFVPEGGELSAGDILVLPGWDFPRTRWQRETGLLAAARGRHFRCIFPEMGKTLYESQYFPETRRRWAFTPGGKWIREYLVPEAQERGLLLPGQNNFLLGLSTGGRGVALVHLSNPGLFKAGAALSGDFDQSVMPRDRLMTAAYGPFELFSERWKNTDNPQTMAGTWTMPIYLGHGRLDAVVPFSQTAGFFEALRKARPVLRIVLNAPDDKGHDFRYWGSEIEPALQFFLSSP